jgi:Raf kinase inhibitor-like YbhB/YbcL family protein
MNNAMLHTEATRAIDYRLLNISSTAFQHEGMIPMKHTCDGRDINPPLDIEHVPAGTRSLVLIMEDPDAPSGTWVHWIVWNIPVTHHIREDAVYDIQGLSDYHQHGYRGPCPPLGTHRYFFKVYALDSLLDLPDTTRKPQLEKAMSEHIIAFGELVGLYERKNIKK